MVTNYSSGMTLPIELLVKIATDNYGNAYREMLAVPQFARFTLDASNRIWLQNQMIRCTITEHQTTYTLNGKWHRNDNPAVIRYNLSAWYQFGKCHRGPDHSGNSQPAVIHVNGTQEWYQNGLRHRDNDQPAVVWIDRTQEWYQNGKLHRDNDQPALVRTSGTKEWYQNGKLHRDNDQPAVVLGDGTQYWFENISRPSEICKYIDSRTDEKMYGYKTPLKHEK